MKSWVLKLKKVVESVQRMTTKLVKGPEGMSYEDWLRTLDLFNLDKIRPKDDLIALWSFLNKGNREGCVDLFFWPSV